jgi:hypothetical protein
VNVNGSEIIETVGVLDKTLALARYVPADIGLIEEL